MTAVAFVMVGFCRLELKLFGPLQLYPVPPEEVRLIVPPTHTGLLEPAVAEGGVQTPGSVVTPADDGLDCALSLSQLHLVIMVWAGPV